MNKPRDVCYDAETDCFTESDSCKLGGLNPPSDLVATAKDWTRALALDAY